MGDSNANVRKMALEMLANIEPATLAQHAIDALAERLGDPNANVRKMALEMLANIEPVTLAQHAIAAIKRLDDHNEDVRSSASAAVRKLPHFVTRVTVNIFDARSVPRRLLGRMGWYKLRLRLRARSIVWYWSELTYRPSGAGHVREAQVWDRMFGKQGTAVEKRCSEKETDMQQKRRRLTA